MIIAAFAIYYFVLMRKTSRIILVVIALCSMQDLFGQPNLPEYDYKRFRFGFMLGYNYATFTSKPNANLNPFDSLVIVEPTGKSGFDIGIVTNLRLGEYFDLRFIPALSLMSRSMDYTTMYSGNKLTTRTHMIESVNLDLPLLFKLKSSRVGNNVRFYAISGVQYSLDMASRSKKRNPPGETVLKLKASDIQFQAGVGIDFYLPYFKLTLEGKMGYGITNLHKDENNFISSSIESLRSKTFHFSIIFE